MTLILGLAGHAGAGKDTVALYLEQRYGFTIFAFSDALYREVTEAFGLESEDLLRDRDTKEEPTELLALKNCKDEGFVLRLFKLVAGTAAHLRMGTDPDLGAVPIIGLDTYLSPRQILQWFGTEYRRAQDPDYWVKKTAEWLAAVPKLFAYPEMAPQLFVNTTVRFPNERQWIHDMGGNTWHVFRRAAKPVALHVSENPLEIWPGERELYNNHTIERLHYGIDLLMTSSARFVAVEPELPREPDANCITAPDGGCTGGQMAGMEPCMHDPKEPQ